MKYVLSKGCAHIISKELSLCSIEKMTCIYIDFVFVRVVRVLRIHTTIIMESHVVESVSN